MKGFHTWHIRFYNFAINRLEAPRREYEQRIYNNMDRLFKFIRKGDVVLVEGNSEISRLIKLFTNSYWSHSAIYVGDELVKFNIIESGTFEYKSLWKESLIDKN